MRRDEEDGKKNFNGITRLERAGFPAFLAYSERVTFGGKFGAKKRINFCWKIVKKRFGILRKIE